MLFRGLHRHTGVY